MNAARTPYKLLLLTFASWKLFLLSLTYLTPTPPYDTSTRLIFPPASTFLEALCQKLTRWDAIYFVKAAQRGYANEQEWAFGWGFVKAVAVAEKLFLPVTGALGLEPPYTQALTAIILSTTSHLLSVLVLYALTLRVFPRTALVAAILHVLSPAGIFLSAPYSESLFSLLSFLGAYLYVRGATLASGAVFCCATGVRSNGLLNGSIFLWDFFEALSKGRWRRVWKVGVAGALVGVGLVLPQVLAWRVYCMGMEDGGGKEGEAVVRPWCGKAIPSIYFFVQEHYWSLPPFPRDYIGDVKLIDYRNVGLFRYWTLPNVPLFLLAAPALTVLISSGLWALATDKPAVVRKLAVPQLLLAVLAISSYHVQIITRLSSGCVAWYWWVADMICEGRNERSGRWVVAWMVVYAVVQGVLFVGFLPPA